MASEEKCAFIINYSGRLLKNEKTVLVSKIVEVSVRDNIQYWCEDTVGGEPRTKFILECLPQDAIEDIYNYMCHRLKVRDGNTNASA